jgi:transcription antitermination factor NusB
MHKKRRATREKTLQILYCLDINGMVESYDKTLLLEETKLHIEHGFRDQNTADKELPFLVIKGLIDKIAFLDDLIEQASENWTLKRLSIIDRNILRLAVYEMAFLSNVPPRVAINEAIEIAKLYGAENSPKFINGVLDRIYRILKRTGFSDDGFDGG